MAPVELPAALAASRSEWIAAVNSGDLDAYAELVSETVTWFAPGPLVIEGRTAFREWLAPFFERFDYEFAVEASGYRVAGSWTIEEGRFRSRMTDRPSGETSVHEGRMLIFWHRADDERWRIERYVDMGSTP